MDKKITTIAELIIFLLCAGVMILCLNRLTDNVDFSGGGFDNFYDTEKNTIDVIAFGSSHAGCTVDVGMMWQKEGIAAFNLTASSQPTECTWYYLLEALKTQTPRAVLVETFRFDDNGPDMEPGLLSEDAQTVIWSSMNMRTGLNRIRMTFEQSRLYGFDLQTTLDLLFKFPILHGDLTEMGVDDVKSLLPFAKGYYGKNTTGYAEPNALTDKRRPLSEKNEEYLRRIIKTCRDKDIPLILFCAPYPVSEKKELACQNTIADIAEEEGVVFLDFNRMSDECGIDFTTDLRNDNFHLNNRGAGKVTEYLINYLKSNYDIPDHRNDNGYASWDLNGRYYEERQLADTLLGAEDLPAWLTALTPAAGNFEILISLNGNYKALGEDAFASGLSGLTGDEGYYTRGGSQVLSKGEAVWASAYSSPRGSISVPGGRQIYADDGTFYIGTEKYEPPENGLLAVVYDPVLDRVVDHIQVNVFEGLMITRSEQNEPDIGN